MQAPETQVKDIRRPGPAAPALRRIHARLSPRATWSSRELARILLRMLVRALVPEDAPIIIEINEMLERRRGAKIAAKGLYRDNYTYVAVTEQNHLPVELGCKSPYGCRCGD